ncbi:aspartyl-tRNA synthetase-like protein [Lindgomyces ingoldianus]|uniref:Aspartyl-tRNA synthetase-like protein n=1 Tax=Lindgomyces ingoldianus TaxID=673940 RepID=A0ACB6RBM4_9PLEO|nr:aspartyl-tRNA synthetase-like protein [Lindgomyces ingoldianus]KAF2476546.1 aspartyl-tRNA synthetase-like protein [Lindgomyces ingoldianus]
MIPRLAMSPVACRNSSLRKSYVEISRFIHSQRHEISRTLSSQCPRNGYRSFSSSVLRRQIEPNDSLRKTLNGYKATIRGYDYPDSSEKYAMLDKHKLGSHIELVGYLGSRRDVSKVLSFALLRDADQRFCVQLVSSPKESVETHLRLRNLKIWTPVLVKGVLQERQPAKDDSVEGMRLINDREIVLESIEPLNDFATDIIVKNDTVFPPEQRHLQIRTNKELREALIFRGRVTKEARKRLCVCRFNEIETPVLFKSTPEGAREFLVPTRNKGLAYALPQSPQQYKQILMASGITRYFQFARCFRDEDLRADRQPEFTQLDLEMAFAEEHQVMHEIEKLLTILWDRFLGINLKGAFRRMPYQEAMASYGSDKPDLRIKSEINTVTDLLSQDLISKITPVSNPVVEAFTMNLPTKPEETRKFVSSFLDSPEGKPFLENPDGQPGVFISDHSKPLNGLGALGPQAAMEWPKKVTPPDGGLLILQARKNEPFSGGFTVLGNLRLALHKAAVAQGILPPLRGFRFLWITDFPLFSPSNDTDPGQGGTAGLSSTHHPFTAPKTPEDVELLLTAPEKAIAAHYDIVVNGVELGGGSRRIHNAEIQEFIFRDVLKMSSERIEDFRHLLDVLRSGCPPHAGIALGWDRMIAVMLGKESVRDVIAFPKSGKGEDMLVKSPNVLTKGQLDTYHLRVKE